MLKRLLAATIIVSACRAAVGWTYPLPVGPQFLANAQTASIQMFPRVAAVGSDGFVVVWTDRSARDGSGFGLFGSPMRPVGISRETCRRPSSAPIRRARVHRLPRTHI